MPRTKGRDRPLAWKQPAKSHAVSDSGSPSPQRDDRSSRRSPSSFRHGTPPGRAAAIVSSKSKPTTRSRDVSPPTDVDVAAAGNVEEEGLSHLELVKSIPSIPS